MKVPESAQSFLYIRFYKVTLTAVLFLPLLLVSQELIDQRPLFPIHPGPKSFLELTVEGSGTEQKTGIHDRSQGLEVIHGKMDTLLNGLDVVTHIQICIPERIKPVEDNLLHLRGEAAPIDDHEIDVRTEAELAPIDDHEIDVRTEAELAPTVTPKSDQGDSLFFYFLEFSSKSGREEQRTNKPVQQTGVFSSYAGT
jgi:hypothetical protein